MLFNLNVEYTYKKVQENREGMKLNETHQLVCAENNLLGEKHKFLKDKHIKYMYLDIRCYYPPGF
jgi:hypothetical protein